MNRYHDLPNRSPNQQRRKCGLSILRSHKNKRKNNFSLALGWWANFGFLFLSGENFLKLGFSLSKKKTYVLFSEKPYIAFLNQNLAGERSGLFFSPPPSILAQIRRDFFSEKKSLPALIIFNSKFNYF